MANDEEKRQGDYYILYPNGQIVPVPYSEGARKTWQQKFIQEMEKLHGITFSEEEINRLFFVSEKLMEYQTEIDDLLPFLENELQKPGNEHITVYDIREADYEWIDDDIVFYLPDKLQAILDAAREARGKEATETKLQQVSYKPGTDIDIIKDKFAEMFFSLAAPQSKGLINGQRQFIQLRYERAGAQKDITLLYDYSFNEDIIKRFGLSNKFDDQAFFVASVIDNLLEEGNQTVSLTKIWHELGNSGSPSTDMITNLANILRLGLSTIITADISQIYDAWGIGEEGKTQELISPVMPIQIVREKFAANGNTTNATVHIMGHTPFYLVGRPIQHFVSWKKDVLRLYGGRRTKRYYSVLRFLITQIGWMRNEKSKRSDKVLYESLYEYTGDKSTRTRQLSRDMMYRLLDEVFIPTGYVSGYVEDNSNGKPGVKIACTQAQKTKKITAKK